MPPKLHWESAVWWLYDRIGTQWRIGPSGKPYGLDYNPAIALMQSMDWKLDLGLELLQVIEMEMLSTEGDAA